MIYLIDEPIKMKDPVQELNEYIDANYLKPIGNMIFTPEILPDPVGLFNRINTGEKNILYPIAAYCDVFTVCYGGNKDGDNAYLTPVGHNLDIDLTRGNGTTIIKQDGTVIAPKGIYDKTINPLDIHTYEQFVNAVTDQDFQDLLSEIRTWTITRLDLADTVYRLLTKED